MKKIFRTALAASIGLTLVACGGSDNKDPIPDPIPDPITPTSMDITGQAIKGTFAGALVEVFNANDLTTAIGSAAQTDETGSFTVTITDAAGEPIVGAYVVQVTADDDSTMICDASVCGDVVRGALIPATDITGVTLSTFTYSDGTGNIEADVNALTTMATDTLLAAASANENIDLATVNAAQVASLQLGASQVVGSMLGLDLSVTNIYNVAIIDATTFTAETTQDTTTSTLTFINASFSGLDNTVGTGQSNSGYMHSAAAEGLGAVIAKYLSTFKEIVELLVVPDADMNSVTPDQLAVINGTQEQFNTLVADIVSKVNSDTGLTLQVEEVITNVSLEIIIEVIAEIEAGTGGTSS